MIDEVGYEAFEAWLEEIDYNVDGKCTVVDFVNNFDISPAKYKALLRENNTLQFYNVELFEEQYALAKE